MSHRSIASLALVFLLVLSGCFGIFGDSARPTEYQGTATPAEAAFSYPDGFDESGITDGAAAVRSHTRGILAYESFTVTYRATVLTPNETVNFTITKSVDTAERRALSITTISPKKRTTFSTRQAKYYANDTVYVRLDVPDRSTDDPTDTNTSYSSSEEPLDLDTVSGEHFVGPVLKNVSYGESTTAERDGDRVARYEDSGLTDTSGLFGENVSEADVTTFSATIAVGPDGVVRHAEYSATIDRGSGERSLSVTIDVSALDSTRVDRPDWVEQAASS